MGRTVRHKGYGGRGGRAALFSGGVTKTLTPITADVVVEMMAIAPSGPVVRE